MKQTFYVHQWADGDTILSSNQMRPDTTLIGTITLDVQPIQREVEKVIEKPWLAPGELGRMSIVTSLPADAYNVKVSYTVKE